MASYFSVEEIYEENKMLKIKINDLENALADSKQKNKFLQEIIDERNNDDALVILEYFHSCSSIRQTANKYNMDMEELYESIPEWDGCRDGLQSADDYDECRLEVIGRKQYEDEQDYAEDEITVRRRTPKNDELDNILNDYKKGKMSLYEIADKYDLWINNLFRLLKENKFIEAETDARDYKSFYTEHDGIWSVWEQGKSDFGLIAEFYAQF
jgi:hypothetical protein